MSGETNPAGKIPTVSQTPVSSNPGAPDSLVVSNSTFVGFEQNMTNMSYPPDVQVAASPSYVMEAVNLEGGIWTKQGRPVAQFPLSNFFALSEDHLISDPRILFDQQSGRWFATIIDATNNTVSIAVSEAANPLGGWHIYKIPYASPCIDFPEIGTSDDKFVVSTNDFTQGCSNFSNSEMVVLDKKEMLDHDSYIGASDLTDTDFSVTPAKSLGDTSNLYMVANNPSETGNTITVYKLVGPAEYAQVFSNYTFTGTMQKDPPAVPQRGTTVALANPPHGSEDAVWSDGNLWSAFTDSCLPAQGFAKRSYSCVHVFSYNTTTGRSLDFEITNSNYNFSYPAVTLDGRGNLYLAFNGVSTGSYPSIYVTGRTASDMPNSVEPLVEVAKSSTYDTSCRYGDYFGAAQDPSDPSRVWVAGEFHPPKDAMILEVPCSQATSSPEWSTYIAGLSLSEAGHGKGGAQK